jgi:ribonuclease VapC
MVVDSSALLAVLLGEQQSKAIVKLMEQADGLMLSAVNYVESSVVIETRKGPAGLLELDHLIDRGAIEIVPVDRQVAIVARRAYRTFGKGYHPAKLNLGDCFAYAHAKILGVPILCTGRDFAKTDIDVAP